MLDGKSLLGMYEPRPLGCGEQGQATGTACKRTRPPPTKDPQKKQSPETWNRDFGPKLHRLHCLPLHVGTRIDLSIVQKAGFLARRVGWKM